MKSKVSFPPRVTTYKKVQEYSKLSYYADLASYTGILLGFSIITLKFLFAWPIIWITNGSANVEG